MELKNGVAVLGPGKRPVVEPQVLWSYLSLLRRASLKEKLPWYKTASPSSLSGFDLGGVWGRSIFFWFWNLCQVTSSQDRAFHLGETDVLVTFTATSSTNGQRCQLPWAAAGACHRTGLWGDPPADWLQLRDHTASSISSLGQVCQQSGWLISEGCLGLSRSLRCIDWHISGCRGWYFLSNLYFDSMFKQFWGPAQDFPQYKCSDSLFAGTSDRLDIK